MELGALNIPKSGLQQFDFAQDFKIRLFMQYSNLLKTHEVGQQLLDALHADPRVAALEGSMVSQGSSAQSFSVETLAMWYLWCANEFGPEAAQTHLESFLDADQIPVVNTLWVLGVEVSEPVELADGYTIMPAEAMPDSADKERFLQLRMSRDGHPTPTPSAAIVRKCIVRKARFDDVPFGPDDDEEFCSADQKMRVVALVLNAVEGVSSVPYYSTAYTGPTIPLGPFGGSGGGWPVYDVIAPGSSALAADRAEEIDALVEAFELLPEAESQRMHRVLNRLSQAKRRLQIEDRVLDMGIALEMLLLDDNANNDQLSLSFRLRGSWLLGSDVADRAAIYGDLKDLYAYRSQVAHSGVLCRGKSAQIAQVEAAFPRYRRLAERVCRKCILENRPAWDKLVLGVI